MFGKKSHLKVVPPQTPQVRDYAWLKTQLQRDWETAGKRVAGWFLERASAHNYFLGGSSNPECMVPLFEEAKSDLEKALADIAGGYLNFCTTAAMDQLTKWAEEAVTSRMSSMNLQRAVAIALVLGIREENREILIGFMRHGGVDPKFGFQAAYSLAKLRKDKNLSREELLDWKIHLLTNLRTFDQNTLRPTLECIELSLGNGSC
ncbi:MAG: hypothetical protein Q7R54_01900 [bacterium]|nr:hypothetical protein [bacterium]